MLSTSKPTTHEQMLFAFELYHRIPRGRKVTAQDLKLELENAGIRRDIRTIQRNLDVVVQYLGVDKDTSSKPYGYSKRFTSYLGFNASEMVLLALAEKTLLSSFSKQTSPAIQRAFQMLREQSPITLKFKSETQLQEKVAVLQPPKSIRDFSLNVLESLSYALCYQYNVNLSLTSKQQTFKVKPLGILQLADELVLVAEHQEGGINTHKLSDIQSLEVSTFQFEYPKNFNLSRYIPDLTTSKIKEFPTSYHA